MLYAGESRGYVSINLFLQSFITLIRVTFLPSLCPASLVCFTTWKCCQLITSDAATCLKVALVLSESTSVACLYQHRLSSTLIPRLRVTPIQHPVIADFHNMKKLPTRAATVFVKEQNIVGLQRGVSYLYTLTTVTVIITVDCFDAVYIRADRHARRESTIVSLTGICIMSDNCLVCKKRVTARQEALACDACHAHCFLYTCHLFYCNCVLCFIACVA